MPFPHPTYMAGKFRPLGNTAGPELQRPRIVVIGCGSAGSNMIAGMGQGSGQGVHLLTCDTAHERSGRLPEKDQIIIGKNRTIGGQGSPLDTGKSSAMEGLAQISGAFRRADLSIILSGLGGQTGTGASLVASEASAKWSALTLGMFSMPFCVESASRTGLARAGVDAARADCDAVLLLPNDILRTIAPHLPMNQAFNVINYALTLPIECMAKLLVMEDVAHLKRVIRKGSIGTIGIGEGAGKERFRLAARDALNLPEVAGVDRISKFIAFISHSKNEFPEDA